MIRGRSSCPVMNFLTDAFGDKLIKRCVSPDQLPFASEKKSVEVSSGTVTINDIFSDAARKPTGKVNVLFEKDSSDKDTLLITIK